MYWMTNVSYSHLGGDAQALFQAFLVLGHSQGEVAVVAVYRAHPSLQFHNVDVAFLYQVVSQLDEELHLLLCLLVT